MQTIINPFGISVLGSALVRTEPDFAVLEFNAIGSQPQPRAAFSQSRETANAICKFLRESHVRDFAVSPPFLTPVMGYGEDGPHVAAYAAKMGFNVVLPDLGVLESILSGVFESGNVEMSPVEFRSSLLQEKRAQAREMAIDAAREKAGALCQAAGVHLGDVVHIEDQNPAILRLKDSPHQRVEIPIDETEPGAFSPSSIVVAAAVVVSFSLLAYA